MSDLAQRAAHRDLMKLARRHVRQRADAEDLLQEALIVGLLAGRAPQPANRAWFAGVLRNLARLRQRGDGRRRAREEAAQADHTDHTDHGGAVPAEADAAATVVQDFILAQPQGLRVVAQLAVSGHDRGEIRHLLRLSDTALRQRLSALKKRWRDIAGDAHPAEFSGLRGGLAFGLIRQALLAHVRAAPAHIHPPLLASHDPDGHLFAVTITRPGPHKSASGGN